MVKKSAAAVIAEIKRIEAEVAKFDDRLPEEVRAAKIEAVRKEAEEAVSDADTSKAALTGKVERKKVALESAKAMTQRVRSVAKGVFGSDSIEYEVLGGKRVSEIKRHFTKKADAE